MSEAAIALSGTCAFSGHVQSLYDRNHILAASGKPSELICHHQSDLSSNKVHRPPGFLGSIQMAKL